MKHRVVHFVALCSLALGTACGEQGAPAAMLVGVERPGDELTVVATNGAHLRLGLGEGDARVDVEVVRVAGPGLQAADNDAADAADGVDVLCLRALDSAGWPFLQAGVVSACGAEFFSPQARPGGEPVADIDALVRRNASVSALLRQMQAQVAPPHAEALWQHAVAHLASFDAPRGGPRPRPAALAAWQPRQSDAAAARRPRRSAKAGLTTGVQPFLGPLDPVIASRGSPHERVEQPSLEFRQEVALYSKKVRQYLLAGKLTDIDHSATHLTVFARGRGSSESWRTFAEAWTRNHGTPASDPLMKHYATCDQLPVTVGYFAWKGECPGKWGEHHICNDDSRYQLWHAYGGWSDTPHCPDTFQGTRPTCRKPW